MAQRLVDRALTVADVLEERIFPAHVPLPPRWGRYYRGEVATRGVVNRARRTAKHAV
ncbi:MAG: hypothetical protein IH621_18175 [Krumholzibacteria bacterium]|nr:hypothetical protein [Candidatus Krumholzibacteria bacterium]